MENKFETDDIQLTAFLLTRKVALIDTVEDAPNHFVFVFNNYESCYKLKIEYLNNASAPAKQLFSQRESLLSEIKKRRLSMT